MLLATEVVPRVPAIEGIGHPKVASYVDVVRGDRAVGATAAIVGAGGIGFDVAKLLSAGAAPDGHASDGRSTTPRSRRFALNGESTPAMRRGEALPPRSIIRRRAGNGSCGGRKRRSAPDFAKTTGWIRRTLLKKRGVAMLAGVGYDRVDDAGLHITVDGVRTCSPST